MNTHKLASRGQPFRNHTFGGTVEAQTIDGFGTILFGILILIASLIIHYVYLIQKKQNIEKRKLEEAGHKGSC